MSEEFFTIIEREFLSCINRSAKLEKLWEGGRWVEGPAYFPASQSLIWSDIPNDRLMRWDETTGHVGIFREKQGYYTNGNNVDRQGRLISCEHGTRRVTRTEYDGSISVIADRYQGKRLNSPNDVVVKSDGSIWFTDPGYGIDTLYEGFPAESEIGGHHVYRVDGNTGNVTIVADDFVRPNGLAFSPDEKKLYIADTGGKEFQGKFEGPRHIRAFDVQDDGTLKGGQVFAECNAGVFDGFRFDEKGRLWSSAGDGVHCFTADGTLIGKILVPEIVSNICFGGPKRNRLFMTGTTSLYAMLLPIAGAKTF